MQEAIKVIKNADPDFKISLAGNYHPEIEKDLYDLCLAFGHNFPADVKARRDKEGKISTVYTCCAEALPNTFTFSPPAEATWIGWHAMAGNYDGYLRWAYNSWTKRALAGLSFPELGCGRLLHCISGKQIKHPYGKTDRRNSGRYEKINILKEEFKNKNNKSKLEKLNTLVSSFTPEGLTKADPCRQFSTGKDGTE